ncbi:MAG: LysR family transcriptional regulator substrate-binding protein, partial [[Eubacterium] siraeum]|nr:LysR family transcriptional regulator substrate-binding protein [[Eubacterium] siraeum]
FLTRAAQDLRKEYPLIHFHVVSGDGLSVIEDLDKGLIDFGLIFGDVDESKYEYIRMPYQDTWGVMMRRDSPLAEKETITVKDLENLPLIISRQVFKKAEFRDLFAPIQEKLNIAATYNLLFNGSLMVDEGMGYALCFDKIINVSGDSNLCFRPLEPRITASMYIVWKKYQVLTKAAELFLKKLKKIVDNED